MMRKALLLALGLGGLSGCGRALTEADVCARPVGSLLVRDAQGAVVDTLAVSVAVRCD